MKAPASRCRRCRHRRRSVHPRCPYCRCFRRYPQRTYVPARVGDKRSATFTPVEELTSNESGPAGPLSAIAYGAGNGIEERPKSGSSVRCGSYGKSCTDAGDADRTLVDVELDGVTSPGTGEILTRLRGFDDTDKSTRARDRCRSK